MSNDICPTEAELLAFVSGESSSASRSIACHIDACEACLELVVALTQQGRPAAPPGGRYSIQGPIGYGGMGVILAATDVTLGRSVVLKTAQAADATARERFEREIHVTARLQHPSIIPVYDSGTLEDGTPFYAMRRVDGEELEALIGGASTPAQRLALLRPYTDLVEAVAYAHAEGFVHRDLKPRNVLVGAFGETVVLDWGLARPIEGPPEDEPRSTESERSASGNLTRTGAIMGTPGYVAPELRRGGQPTTCSDVYSLGIILRRILTGEEATSIRPDDLEPLRKAGAPTDLLAIVARATSPQPSGRYLDAGALAADLRHFEAGRLVEARAYRWIDRVARFVKRHRATVTTAALSVGVVVGLTVWTIVRIDAARDEAESALLLANAAEQRATGEREAAESLVDFALRDLSKELRRAGRLEALGRLSSEVDEHYVQRGTSNDALRILRHARALSIGARVTEEEGSLEAAHEGWTQTLAVLTLIDAAEIPPDGTHYLRIDVESSLAMLLAKQGQLERAVIAAESAMTNARSRVEAHGDTMSPRDRLCLPLAQWRLMILLAHVGRMTDAARLGESILSTVDPTGRRSPVAELRSGAEGLLARHALAQGRHEAAMAHMRRAVAEAESLRMEYPRSVISLDLVATHRFELAQHLASVRDLQATEEELSEVLLAQEMLVAIRPDVVSAIFKLSNTRTTLAAVLVERGDPQRAVALLHEDEQTLRTLDSDKPGLEGMDELLGFTQISLASALVRSGELDRAGSFYQQGLERLGRAAKPGSPPGVRARLAYAQMEVGRFHQLRDDPEAAVAALESARSLREQLAGDAPTWADTLGVAEVTARLADANWRAGDARTAQSLLDEVIAAVLEAREGGASEAACAPVIDTCRKVATAMGRDRGQCPLAVTPPPPERETQ